MLIMDHIKNQKDDQKLPGESWKQKKTIKELKKQERKTESKKETEIAQIKLVMI